LYFEIQNIQNLIFPCNFKIIQLYIDYTMLLDPPIIFYE
jgi:hypothetical protein